MVVGARRWTWIVVGSRRSAGWTEPRDPFDPGVLSKRTAVFEVSHPTGQVTLGGVWQVLMLTTLWWWCSRLRFSRAMTRGRSRWTVAAVVVWVVAECVHYARQSARFTDFDSNRFLPTTPVLVNRCRAALLRQNPQLLERVRSLGLRQTHHLGTRDALEASLSFSSRPCTTPPPHQMSMGHTKLFWRYQPLCWSVLRHLIGWFGQCWLCQRLGFTRTWHQTEDGDYAVWSKVVEGTRPIVVFPGLGPGAVIYAGLGTRLGRTMHLIEVPNIYGPGQKGYRSDRQCTAQTVFTVVSSHVPDQQLDLIAHSFGASVATMYLNEAQARPDVLRPLQQAVFCDGCSHSVDFVRSNLYPFVDTTDYGRVGTQMSRLTHRLFVTLCTQNLEFQAWSKRFMVLHDCVLWREYPNVRMLHIYGTADVLFDVPYIRSRVRDSVNDESFLFLEHAAHGDSLFGASATFASIHQWLTPV